jgi:hypothetical protein
MALLEGTTAPEMMLLPYRREPATGSRMPSMSTGGAATKAMMKQIVAAERSGDHQHTEPTDVETVVGGGDPLAELGLSQIPCQIRGFLIFVEALIKDGTNV